MLTKMAISLVFFRFPSSASQLGNFAVRVAGLAILLIVAASAPAEEIIGQAQVLDGDSIRIGQVEIRLHGIDAPESRQTCLIDGQKWRCGRSATRALHEMLGSTATRCTWRQRDTYKRALATCFSGGVNINAKMVYSGMALAYTHYTNRYAAEQAQARQAARGVWSSEFSPPWKWRRAQRGQAQ